MREPAWLDGAKEPKNEVAAGVSGVSIPDRRRIDSDVRAFLREPSTPWIVFDRDGRPPSQLAVGEMLSVPRRTLLSEHGFYQATQALAARPAEDVTADSSIEPSSVALASDLAQEDAAVASPEASLSTGDALDASSASIASMATRIFGMPRRRVLGIAAAAALVAAAAIAIVAMPSSTTSARAFANAAAQAPATDRASEAVAAPAARTTLDTPAKPAAVAAASAAAPIAVVATAAKVVPPAPRKHARLSISGEARSREVFLDGKRLLGRGARNFTILCGPHTIAVGTRTDMREVDVPCTGSAELVIAK